MQMKMNEFGSHLELPINGAGRKKAMGMLRASS
jgi:hypothetical protein